MAPAATWAAATSAATLHLHHGAKKVLIMSSEGYERKAMNLLGAWGGMIAKENFPNRVPLQSLTTINLNLSEHTV
jgi:hypothetical protein